MAKAYCIKTWLVRILLLVMPLGQLALAELAQSEDQQAVTTITSGEFCETDASFSTSDCTWRPVRLPHRWSPTRAEEGWGVYHFSVPRPVAGSYGLVARRLSLTGTVFVEGQAIASSTPGIGRPVYVRYWPQIYPFQVDPQNVSKFLNIQVRVQGHTSMKNGLGQLILSVDGVARKMFVVDLLSDVVAVVAMACAITMTGLLGFFASRRDHPSERLLFMVSGLSVLAALRMTVIFISDPPLPLGLWSALSLSLFVWISLWILAILVTYLKSPSKSVGTLLWISGVVITVLACFLPSSLLQPFVDAVLLALSLAGVIMLGLVFAVVRRKNDFTGWQLLTSFVIVVALLSHDLMIHFSSETIAGNYILLQTVPILIIMLAALLMRTLRSQRDLESALQAATDRRDDLLRDLHDGIGSRLVALSFSVRSQGVNTSITSEVDGLIHELQVIQKAVRSVNTDLQSLFSDLRHLYSQVGGGCLPLQWELNADIPSYPLSSDQAIAVVRILEESIANAMKHARPSRIDISLTPSHDQHAVTLSVSDNGTGHFQPAKSGGLRNIELRAQRAGLNVRFEESHGAKRVLLQFPRLHLKTMFFNRSSIHRWIRWQGFLSR